MGTMSQPPEGVRKQLDEMNVRMKADPNRLSRDLAFELSCWDSLINGVDVKYGDLGARVVYLTEDGLHLRLDGVTLVQHYPCDAVSLDGVVRIENIGGVSVQWKIDASLLKSFRPYPPENDLIIIRSHDLRYDHGHEMRLRTVLQFKGKNCPIQFYNYFCDADENEAGVVVDTCGFISAVITGIRFHYAEKKYLLYSCAENSRESNYIVVESEVPVDRNVFSEVVRRILNVVGFFTGHFMFGPFLIFSPCEGARSELVGYEDSLPNSCESIYTMTGMNPYWYFAASDVHRHPSEHGCEDLSSPEALRSKLMPFRRCHVEKLMDLLDDKDFSLMFYTLIENSMSQHMRMATSRLIAYAACLEMGGSWFKKRGATTGTEVDAAFLPESIRTEIVKRLQKGFDEYLDGLKVSTCSDDGSNITDAGAMCADPELMDKLRIVRLRIGSELCKQTNAAKLEAQFVENGMILTKEEKKLLNGRNRILHGADSVEVTFDPQSPEPYIEVSEGKCFEYYALIWRLIMHVIGYDGVFCDVAGVQSAYRNHKANNGVPFIREV